MYQKLPSMQILSVLLWLDLFACDFLAQIRELRAICFLPFPKPSSYRVSPSSQPALLPPFCLWQAPSEPVSLSVA